MSARSVTLTCAAPVLAFVACTAGATGIPQLTTPTVNVNGDDVTGSLDCGLVGAVTVCSANNIVGAGFTLNNLSLTVNPDPQVTSTFTLTNLSAVPQNFFLTITLPIASLGPPISIAGYAGPSTLTDAGGGGATVHDAGVALYRANINGATVQTLLDPVWSYSTAADPFGGPGPPVTIPMLSYGPTTLAQAATPNIQIAWAFNLTSQDEFSSTGKFEANPVPLPGAGALFGSGLMGLVGVARKKAGYKSRAAALTR
jgi:hypothetical protein